MSDWGIYRQLRLVVNVAVRHPSTGETVWFRVGDDPPEWARRLMGPHVYGFAAGPERPKGMEVISSWRGADGLPDVVDVVCSESGHRRNTVVRRFEAVSCLELESEGRPPSFDWWMNRIVGSKQETDAEGHPVGWDKPRRDPKSGRWLPGEQLRHSVNLKHCRLSLPLSWSDMALQLDQARHANAGRLDLREMIYTRTR